MKKVFGIVAAVTLGVAGQLYAQCPAYANVQSSPNMTVEWERSGNTLYYHISVWTASEFIYDPNPSENYLGMDISGIGWVVDMYWDAETFPYGFAEYCGTVDITGFNPAEVEVYVSYNVVEPDRYNDQYVAFYIH